MSQPTSGLLFYSRYMAEILSKYCHVGYLSHHPGDKADYLG